MLFSPLISHRFTIFITYTSTTGNYRTTKICKYTCTCTLYMFTYMYMYTYIYMYTYMYKYISIVLHNVIQIIICTSIQVYWYLEQSTNSENFLLNEDVTARVFLNHTSLHSTCISKPHFFAQHMYF